MSICQDMLPPQVTLSIHSFRVAYSWPLCANMTTYTKPEVHVVYTCRKRRRKTTPNHGDERHAQKIWWSSDVWLIPEIWVRGQTDRSTYGDTDIRHSATRLRVFRDIWHSGAAVFLWNLQSSGLSDPIVTTRKEFGYRRGTARRAT